MALVDLQKLALVKVHVSLKPTMFGVLNNTRRDTSRNLIFFEIIYALLFHSESVPTLLSISKFPIYSSSAFPISAYSH